MALNLEMEDFEKPFVERRQVEDPLPYRPAGQHFRGVGIETVQDELRLDSQYDRILRLMRDGQHRTLAMISRITGDPEASISRQLRYADDPRWNSGFKLRKTNLGEGLWTYWLAPTPEMEMKLILVILK